MKKHVFTLSMILGLSILLVSCSQEKKEVKKEIEVSEINGATTVEVTVTKNGQTTTETYTGKEARQYLAEVEKNELREGNHETSSKDISIEIKIDKEDSSLNDITLNLKDLNLDDLEADEIKEKIKAHMSEMYPDAEEIKISVDVDKEGEHKTEKKINIKVGS